ncbi:MAG: hypothetical protein HQK60_06505 [Deltaproteobacteria bacterium]|nr:hypothetical protein [Deltaproteobacteria bacterium]
MDNRPSPCWRHLAWETVNAYQEFDLGASTPGRENKAVEDFDFKERLEELETLAAEARDLEDRIAENVANLLEADI